MKNFGMVGAALSMSGASAAPALAEGCYAALDAGQSTDKLSRQNSGRPIMQTPAGYPVGEAVLDGLGGCFMSNLLAAARARNVELKNARADIEGDMADAPPRFTAIRMSVPAQCNPPEELNKLVTIAERGCIAANTLRAAAELSIKVVWPGNRVKACAFNAAILVAST